MQKKTIIIILVVIFSVLLIGQCNASDITDINSIVENAKEYNDCEVTIQGELIGEAMEREDGFVWLNINDGTNAIGVWIEKSNISQIQFYGDYKHKGDIVKITGIFYNSCTEHGGDVDIHSSKLEVVDRGFIVNNKVPTIKIIIAAILFTLTLLILTLYYVFLKNPNKKSCFF